MKSHSVITQSYPSLGTVSSKKIRLRAATQLCNFAKGKSLNSFSLSLGHPAKRIFLLYRNCSLSFSFHCLKSNSCFAARWANVHSISLFHPNFREMKRFLSQFSRLENSIGRILSTNHWESEFWPMIFTLLPTTQHNIVYAVDYIKTIEYE